MQTSSDETVEATCNEEEVAQASAQSMICQGKENKNVKNVVLFKMRSLHCNASS